VSGKLKLGSGRRRGQPSWKIGRKKETGRRGSEEKRDGLFTGIGAGRKKKRKQLSKKTLTNNDLQWGKDFDSTSVLPKKLEPFSMKRGGNWGGASLLIPTADLKTSSGRRGHETIRRWGIVVGGKQPGRIHLQEDRYKGGKELSWRAQKEGL